MNNKYARLTSRVKAAFVDAVALIVMMYSSSEILNLFENVPNALRVSIFVFIFLLYEPLLVSIFGATIGHFFNDILVKRESNEQRNINFPIAIIRLLLKVTLGWISLLTITGNEKGQAIHDFAAKSVVKVFEK